MARILKVSPVTVHEWVHGKQVPILRCWPIEKATGGVVSRQDLRSDWREIWPELAEER